MAGKTAPLSGGNPEAIKRTVATLNETVDTLIGARGDPLEQVVRHKDLVALGLAKIVGGKLVKV